MIKKFIAISNKGSEYMFKKSIIIAVPTKSAQIIADALNKVNYQLKPGELWHVHDNDFYFDTLITHEIKSYRKNRNIKLYSY